MIAFRAFVIVMTCLVPSVCFAFQGNEPAVGMVLWAEGAGDVERNDVRSPLLLGDVLFAGDRLIIGSGTATVLFCPTSERIELGAETVTDLSVDSFSVVEGPPATSSAANNCQLPQVSCARGFAGSAARNFRRHLRPGGAIMTDSVCELA